MTIKIIACEVMREELLTVKTEQEKRGLVH